MDYEYDGNPDGWSDEELERGSSFIEDVAEFIEVCRYNNRTAMENLRLLCEDNPEPNDVEYFTRVAKIAQIELENYLK